LKFWTWTSKESASDGGNRTYIRWVQFDCRFVDALHQGDQTFLKKNRSRCSRENILFKNYQSILSLIKSSPKSWAD
jgi:hypothetical protein